jgi:TRAP-type C4-dicarboxylate transport system substrate-binding protein
MRTPSLLGTSFALMATLILTASPVDAKPKTLLKVATLAPEESTWMRIMRSMDAEVREATGDAVGFKFYPNAVQGDEAVVLRRIRNGQLHGAGVSGAGLGAIAPEVRVLELPFLLESDAEVDRAHAAIDDILEAAIEEKGFILLGWAEVGPIHLFTNTPVRSAPDMSGVKMWLWEGDPVSEAIFEAFRIPPIPLSIAHVMTSLQTGMIDGVYASPYACIALQWFTRISHMMATPMAHATGGVVVSKKAFEKIPSDHQATVRRIAREHLDEIVAATRRENLAALTTLTEQGVTSVAPDPAAMAGFRERAREVWQTLSGDLYPESLLERVVTAVKSERNTTAGSAG